MSSSDESLVVSPRRHLFSAHLEIEGEEKDSMALLNEILGSMSVDEGDFSREWTEVFGDTEEGTGTASGRPTENSFFLPSQLLDQSSNHLQSSLSGQNRFPPRLSPLFFQQTLTCKSITMFLIRTSLVQICLKPRHWDLPTTFHFIWSLSEHVE